MNGKNPYDNEIDEEYLRMAFSLARKGEGEVSPNPIVGAIIVKEGMVVGKGFHRRAGEKHAEIAALDEAGDSARGGTLYLNLEPCCHYGKTPPCCERIIEAGIGRVVCSMKDPNPLVNGKGFGSLRSSGITVEEGLLRREAERLNEVFLKYMKTGRPFVIAKVAMSLDGKIATASGESQWISSPESRKYIHNRIRYCVDSILVGVNTVLHDDPSLTARGTSGRKKRIIRIVLDSTLKTPPGSKLLASSDGDELWIYTIRDGGDARRMLEDAGARVVTVREENRRCSMEDVITDLGRREIASVLIEGGSKTLASAFRGRLVDKVIFFIAPMLLGGGDAISAIGDIALQSLSQAIKLEEFEVVPIDRDIMYRGYPRYQ